MLGLKLDHVSKRGPRWHWLDKALICLDIPAIWYKRANIVSIMWYITTSIYIFISHFACSYRIQSLWKHGREFLLNLKTLWQVLTLGFGDYIYIYNHKSLKWLSLNNVTYSWISMMLVMPLTVPLGLFTTIHCIVMLFSKFNGNNNITFKTPVIAFFSIVNYCKDIMCLHKIKHSWPIPQAMLVSVESVWSITWQKAFSSLYISHIPQGQADFSWGQADFFILTGMDHPNTWKLPFDME